MKKGQASFGISFGMIFSIFIIIAILSTAIYVIYHFVSASSCGQLGIFYEELQKNINNAWNSERVQKNYESSILPKGIQKVCFGDPSTSSSAEANEIKFHQINQNSNVFIYPKDKSCEGMSERTLAHFKIVDASGNPAFFCQQVSNKKIKIKLIKQRGDALVKITSS